MKILTKAILKKLPSLDDTAELTTEEQTVHLKLFNIINDKRWHIYAYDPETEMAMAYVTCYGEYPELVYVNLGELKRVYGWTLERDRWFDSMNLKELMSKKEAGQHV